MSVARHVARMLRVCCVYVFNAWYVHAACVRVHVCACVCVCVRARVHVRVCVRACVWHIWFDAQVDTVGADAAAAPPEYTADDAVPPPYTTDEPQPPQYTEGAAAPPAYSDAV